MSDFEISPVILGVAIVIGLVMLLIQVFSIKFSRVVIGMMLLVSSLGVAIDYYGNPQRTFLYPIQLQRSAIYMALGLFLYAGLFFHLRQVSLRKFSLLGGVLLAMGLYQGLMRYFHEGPQEAAETMVFFLATMLPLLLIVPALLRTWDDFNALLRVIVFVGALWTLGSMVQFVIYPKAIIYGNAFRFVGLLGNPQHAGTMLGPLAAVTLWLMLFDTKKRYKPLMLISFGVFMIMVIWTGSRTGIGMFALGAAAAMYSRVGRSALLLPFGLVAVYAMYKASGLLGIELGAERMVSTENTRTESWLILFDSARNNPLFGAGAGEDGAGDTENSYLYAVAAYGLGMGMLVAMLVIGVVVQSLRLLRVKSRMPASHKTLPDMIIGFFAMYLGGSVFEGIMLARVSAPLTEMVIFTCMATCLIQKAYFGDPALYDPEPGGEADEYDHEYDSTDFDDNAGHDDHNSSDDWSEDTDGLPG